MTPISLDNHQLIENFVKPREILLNEVTLLIHELGMMNLETNGIERIGVINNNIRELKATTDEFSDQVQKCESTFEKVVEERSHKLLTLKFTTCLEKQHYEAAFRLMVDHPEWVEHNKELALRAIKELTHRVFQSNALPKSLGDLVLSLFRNNPELEELAQDFTLEVRDEQIQCNLLLVGSNFSALFSMGAFFFDFKNPSLPLDCSPDSLKTILAFLVSKNEASLLPLLEENYITANRYGIGYVTRAVRNQLPVLKQSMELDAWIRLVSEWQKHPVLKYLTSSPLGRELDGAPVEFKEEHEGRILYSLDLLEQFALRLKRGKKFSFDSYFNLYQVREAADLLLRSASSGQIQQDFNLFERYQSILNLICKKITLNEDRLLLIHEGELLTPIDEAVKVIKPIFMSCISANNILEPTLEPKLVENKAWHGDCLKQALHLIGKQGDNHAQSLVSTFAGNAIYRQVNSTTTEGFHVLFRHSSTSPSAITATFSSPITHELRHIRIQVTRRGEEWLYSKSGFPEEGSFSTPMELMAHIWRDYGFPIIYVPRPEEQSELFTEYIDHK